ncbi:MAG: hypothetical protein WKG00_20200 [Polyangiaceae bacterium]
MRAARASKPGAPRQPTPSRTGGARPKRAAPGCQAAAPSTPPPAAHGSAGLSAVEVTAYNAQLRDTEAFIGDRASKRAFQAILDDWRERLRRVGDDPLGDAAREELSKKKLDRILVEGDPEAAGVIHGTIEDFARELCTVAGRFLRQPGWKGAERIVVGGGLRASRVGELAIGRASVLLKSEGHAVDMVPIRYHPDRAGLIGAVHLAPPWIFAGYDGLMAMDIGGSNFRVGVVQLHLSESSDLSGCTVWASDLWRHAEDQPTRAAAIDRLMGMLAQLVQRAQKKGFRLAPFVGVGCPGVIEEDGAIARGGQNLPGNWERNHFNLPAAILEALPRIGDHSTHVVVHNDAVVQGLSEVPFMAGASRWGVLTIGTGLGNACFQGRARPAGG